MDLSKEITFRKKSKKVEIPSKTTMNLYQKEKTGNEPSKIIPLFVVLVVLIAVFCKFGIMDRYAKLDLLHAQNEQLLIERDVLEQEVQQYDDVYEQYVRYTDYYQTYEEYSTVDRLAILSMLQDTAESVGHVYSTTIQGNSISLSVRVDYLEQLATIRKNMEAIDWVSSVTVYTASSTDSSRYSNAQGDYVSGTIVFTVVPEEVA